MNIKYEYLLFIHVKMLSLILIRLKYFHVPSLYSKTLSIRFNFRIHCGYDGDVIQNKFPVNLDCSNGNNSPKS